MRAIFLMICLLPVVANTQTKKPAVTNDRLNHLAEAYVHLGLTIGLYDPDFVDAYYGPDNLKPVTVKQTVLPKDSLLKVADQLINQLRPFFAANNDVSKRAKWISSQLVAAKRRIKVFSGEQGSFDQEAKELFGVQPPTFTENYFRTLVNQLDQLLPGKGDVKDRFQLLANRFIIPADKLDTIYRTTIAETRKRTLQHYPLPATEDFRLEYVTGKPWSGYNWYQGQYQSLIQINSDITAYIEKAIDVASHEGYPGHHVYNTLLEKHLYKDKGWVEVSLYPLFSPQSLIAEGGANFGIEVVFPGTSKIQFASEVLLPLAGLDTTGLSLYFRVLALKEKLKFSDIEITRRLVDGKITEAEAIRWTMEYSFTDEKGAARSLAFKKKYRSYVINYTFGLDIVKRYIENNGGTEKNLAKRWSIFHWLLQTEVMPADLMTRKMKR